MLTPRELHCLYQEGKNISQAMRDELGITHNTKNIIEVSYDLQAGSYIAGMKREAMVEHKKRYGSEIAKTISELCDPVSILEAGVGEATTFAQVLKSLNSDVAGFGFDLSWSRVACARHWLKYQGVQKVSLCTANLLNIPFADDSIDVVYTSHSIEPNGGNEKAILQELFRVTKKYLVLLEPGYELASEKAKQRMDSHGYCKNLKGVAEQLGFEVLHHDLFPFTANPLNPTAITVIRKQAGDAVFPPSFACPQFKTPLENIGGMLFSPEALVVYPVIGGIPCLRVENGVFASKYRDITSDSVVYD